MEPLDGQGILHPASELHRDVKKNPAPAALAFGWLLKIENIEN